MKIYNTLTKKKETFKSIEEGKVRMYVCGPTVYNYIHIGNARPSIVYDTIRNYLEYKGYEVNYVQNFTDIDDKIIKRANEEGVQPSCIAERFIKEALEDAKGLGIREATKHPKATEEVEGIIEMIDTLIEKGYAYVVDGTVYFETCKWKEYGKLSKKNQDELEAGARIAVNDAKRNPMDFVLWKPKKEGEIAWESPWGEGRPGWHIECSVMAKKYLGDQIDIHAGGMDLVFPHHENEIAQSEAANDVKFANYWMHNGFINVDNKKMSKSLNNFFTVRDIAKEFSYDVIRFFMLSAHYRSPVNFSRELMESSQKGLERIKTGGNHLRHLLGNVKNENMTDNEKQLITELDRYRERFEEAMDDDFNTADAISVIFELVKYSNTIADHQSSKEWLEKIYGLLESLCAILGIVLEEEAVLLDEDIEKLIEQRQQARKDRNFALADEIRDRLKEKGIVLEDTREGIRFKRL